VPEEDAEWFEPQFPLPAQGPKSHCGGGGEGQEGNWEGQSLNKIILSDMLYITKWYSAQPLWLNKKSHTEGPGPCPPPGWSPGRLPTPPRAGQGSRVGREWCLGWNCIVRWGGWAWQGSPMGRMSQLDPTSCWPSLAGPGRQLDPVGLQGSSLPPATHFVEGRTPPDAAGPVGSKAGKGCGEVTGMGGG